MQTSKSLWLGALALALAIITTPAWTQAQGRDGGNAGIHANSFVTSQDHDRNDAPAASPTANAADRSHQRSLDQDADRVHQRRQRHHANPDAHTPDRRPQHRADGDAVSLANAPDAVHDDSH